jgi:hypothetical protein
MENNFRSETQSARGFAQRLKEDGRQTIEQRKRSAADRVESIAQALERTGEQFGDNEPTLADYANRLAGNVGNLATRLREGSIEELIDDTRELARRNPALFIAGGVAVGFVLARFVKASASRPLEQQLSDDEQPLSEDDAPTLTEEFRAEAVVVDVAADPGVTSGSAEPGYTAGSTRNPSDRTPGV